MADGAGFSIVLPALSAHAPALAADLDEDDQTRATISFYLMAHLPLALRALEEIRTIVDVQTAWARNTSDQVLAGLAVRLRSDVRSGVNAIFLKDFPTLMDVCRDLMELMALFYDFKAEPQRESKWVRTDANTRGRDFSFARTLKKNADGMGISQETVTRLIQEYAVHSQTLHPAPWISLERELTREPETNMDPRAWIIVSCNEFVKHAYAATNRLFEWLVESHSAAAPNIDFVEPTGAAAEWIDFGRSFNEKQGFSPGSTEEFASRATQMQDPHSN